MPAPLLIILTMVVSIVFVVANLICMGEGDIGKSWRDHWAKFLLLIFLTIGCFIWATKAVSDREVVNTTRYPLDETSIGLLSDYPEYKQKLIFNNLDDYEVEVTELEEYKYWLWIGPGNHREIVPKKDKSL
jgi:hypothetical protein